MVEIAKPTLYVFVRVNDRRRFALFAVHATDKIKCMLRELVAAKTSSQSERLSGSTSSLIMPSFFRASALTL